MSRVWIVATIFRKFWTILKSRSKHHNSEGFFFRKAKNLNISSSTYICSFQPYNPINPSFWNRKIIYSYKLFKLRARNFYAYLFGWLVCRSVCLSLEKMSKIVKNQDFAYTTEHKSYQSCWIDLRYISRFLVCLSVSLSTIKCQKKIGKNKVLRVIRVHNSLQ